MAPKGIHNMNRLVAEAEAADLHARSASGEHEFDALCSELGIEHRLSPPKHPQSEAAKQSLWESDCRPNGMVERFNGRIEEVLQSHHFRSGEEREATLLRYVWLYNQTLPQSAIGSRTPMQEMKQWYQEKPELFQKTSYNLTGFDTYGCPEMNRN